jgi:8-oxo-dGTP pyrophosphatase MutT (NUDIX family)
MNSSGRDHRLARTYETSAGGFVLSSDGGNRVALIARINRGGQLDWCIPKGHPENEETLHEAAIREISEETGILGEILAEIGKIQYEFNAAGKKIVKTVHHFLLRQTGGELTIDNDPVHEAVAVEWVAISDVLDRLSHENEKNMAREMLRILEGLSA